MFIKVGKRDGGGGGWLIYSDNMLFYNIFVYRHILGSIIYLEGDRKNMNKKKKNKHRKKASYTHLHTYTRNICRRVWCTRIRVHIYIYIILYTLPTGLCIYILLLYFRGNFIITFFGFFFHPSHKSRIKRSERESEKTCGRKKNMDKNYESFETNRFSYITIGIYIVCI